MVWLAVSAAAAIGLWGLVGAQPTWGPVALYAWAGVSVSITLVQVWHLVSQRFTFDAAKRVCGLVGAGSVLGAIAGALAGGAVAAVLPVRHLLLGAAALHLLAVGVAPALGGGGRVVRRVGSMGLPRDLRAVLRHPYARRLVALSAVATVSFTLVDYLFKAQVAASVAPEALGTWFAAFYAVTNAVALVVQVMVTGAAIRGLGVRRAIAVLPTLLVLGAGGLVAGLGLGAALVLKGAEGALKHTLHKTSMEVLFVPVPAGLRARMRRVTDLLVLRGAQGLGSGLILGVLALGGGGRALAAVALSLGVAWVALAAALRDHYLALFRGILSRAGGTSHVRPDAALDLSALEALLEALNSDDDDAVVASLDLLHQADRTRVVPALVLFHPSPRVVERALDHFSRAGRTDHLAKATRLFSSDDPRVRAAVVRAHPDPELSVRALSDPAAIVRCAGMASMLGEGGARAGSVAPMVRDIVSRGEPAEREALAHALRHQHHDALQVRILAELAEAATTARERSAVAASLLASPQLGHVPAALSLLATRAARRDARRAIVAVGPDALPLLDASLADPDQAERVRIHVPAVVAEMPGPASAALLTRWLHAAESGVVRYRVLRALNRLHGLAPDLAIPRGPLEQSVAREIANLYLLLDWSILLARGVRADPARDTPGHELLRTLVEDKRASVRERLFRLLDLLHDGEDFEDLWRGVLSDDPHRRASSLELLEHTLPLKLRAPARGLFDPSRDELPRRRRLAPGAPFHTPFEGDYASLVGAMLRAGSGSVQAIAAWHAGELGLVALLPDLEAIALSPHLPSAEVVEHAIARLRGDGAQARPSGGAAR
jgi:hypothetical protein